MSPYVKGKLGDNTSLLETFQFYFYLSNKVVKQEKLFFDSVFRKYIYFEIKNSNHEVVLARRIK